MRFSVKIGDSELVHRRGWLSAAMTITVDGRLVAKESWWRLSTQISFKTVRSHEFDVGSHRVIVERTRHQIYGGVRPQRYRVFVDGALVVEIHGF